MSVTLTNDQKNAMAQFTAFLLGSDRFMVISGPAGVGKTTVLKHMLASIKNPNSIVTLMGGDPIRHIEATATTNKAAEVLKDALGVREVKTIHSFLNLSLKNDFATGHIRLVRGKDFKILKDTLLIIDECSMVDLQLLKLIKESTINCKVIFMGDRCQMAPVFEDESEVFRLPGQLAEIEEVVRNRGVPALGAICKQLRTTVKSGIFTPVIPVAGAIELLSPEEMQAHLDQAFVKEEGLNKRILGFSNNRVQTYNAYIREARGLPLEYQAGETVISNSVVIDKNDGPKTRIEQLIQVHGTGQTELDPFLLKFGWEIPVYSLSTSVGTLVQPVDFAQIDWALKQLARAKDWANYFHIKQSYADLRMPQAATVYKAQGSTYDTVYIDLGDIGNCKNPAQTARMLYVAFSRAAKKVYLYGELPKRYQGI